MSWGVYKITSSEGGVRLINGIAQDGCGVSVSPELELVNGSVCKACSSKLEMTVTYLATAENITNEL